MTEISRRGVLGAGALATALTVTGALGGMGWVPRVNNGTVTRRLRAQCVQISQGSSFVVMLRVDVISIPSDVFKRIQQGLVGLGVLQAEQFMFTSSHNHTSPMMGNRPDAYVLQGITGDVLDSVAEFTDIFVDTMIDLVRQTPGDAVRTGDTRVRRGLGFLAKNRIDWTVPTLPDVPVLLVRPADTGIPVAVLFGYARHPVCCATATAFDSDNGARHAERMISLIDAGGLPRIMPMMVQVWEFGGLKIIAMANEITAPGCGRGRRCAAAGGLRLRPRAWSTCTCRMHSSLPRTTWRARRCTGHSNMSRSRSPTTSAPNASRRSTAT